MALGCWLFAARVGAEWGVAVGHEEGVSEGWEDPAVHVEHEVIGRLGVGAVNSRLIAAVGTMSVISLRSDMAFSRVVRALDRLAGIQEYREDEVVRGGE